MYRFFFLIEFIHGRCQGAIDNFYGGRGSLADGAGNGRFLCFAERLQNVIQRANLFRQFAAAADFNPDEIFGIQIFYD